MPVGLFRRVIEQVAPLTEMVCFHLMGDPLVHPELETFIEICQEHSVKIFLVTNGVLLREKQAELLLHPVFHQVNFSLHSFFDNFPERDPASYLEKIFAFTERAFEVRPELYINYRLWNLESRVSGPKNASARNQDMLARVLDRFSAHDRLENYDVEVTRQKSRKLKNRLYLHFDTEFVWPALDLPVLGTQGTCHGLSSHFGILVDGTVVPCCLDKEAGIPLGNVFSANVADILLNERSQNILKGFRERRLIEDLCQRCQYIERFS